MNTSIRILTYHSVGPECSGRMPEGGEFYNITSETFIRQMRYLKNNRYHTISLDKLKDIKNANDILLDKSILLTFDDGHISNYETVLPILKEFGFTAVFFLSVNDIGKKHIITWEQAKKLKESGMEIGSHGMNHKILNKLPYSDLAAELKLSKAALEQNIGIRISAFSIPRGIYSKKISVIAKEMGYELVFTSFTGATTSIDDNYCLKRFVMLRHYSMNDFISLVQNSPIFMLRKQTEQFIKNGIQRIIGIEKYDRIKNAIFSRS